MISFDSFTNFSHCLNIFVLRIQRESPEYCLFYNFNKSTECPTRNIPYLSSNFSKSVFYLIKFLKEICYTMLNLDLSICFISVSARIDFL